MNLSTVHVILPCLITLGNFHSQIEEHSLPHSPGRSTSSHAGFMTMYPPLSDTKTMTEGRRVGP